MRANKYIEVLSVFEPLGSKWRQMGYSLFIQNVLANVHLSNLKQFSHIFFLRQIFINLFMKRVVTLNFTQVSDIDHRPFNFLANIFFSISEAFFIIDVKLHSNVKDNDMKISLSLQIQTSSTMFS